MVELLLRENLRKGDVRERVPRKPGIKEMVEHLVWENPGKGEVLREKLEKGDGRGSTW